MDDQMVIVSPGPSQVEELAALGRQAFISAYRVTLPERELLAYVREAFGVERLRHELQAENVCFFIARSDDNGIIGYIKILPSQLPACISSDSAIELQRLYVKEGFTGMGVGSRLLERGEKCAAQGNFDHLWLRVWEGNNRAIQMYLDRGYAVCGNDSYQVGIESRKVFVMQKTIKDPSTL